MPWLSVREFNGQRQVAIDYSYPRNNVRQLAQLIRKLEITDADARLGIDVLVRIFADWISTGTLPKVIVAKDLIPKTKESPLLDTIIGIIKTSHFQGEIENAMRVYEQITGKPYKAGDV